MKKDRIQGAVRTHYSQAANRVLEKKGRCCCANSPECCAGTSNEDALSQLGYEHEQISDLHADARQASLGCGNPVLLANLRPKEKVLDLGSGGGIDVFLAARAVGPGGFVTGLDMTDEMLELAEQNRQEAGLSNVRFIKGEMESIPLEDASVDVVISNCVINLSPDKQAVLQEAYRVLGPGGRLAVSDTVFTSDVPEQVRSDEQLWACCVGGALHVDEYEEMLKNAGFEAITIDIAGHYEEAGVTVANAAVKARKPV